MTHGAPTIRDYIARILQEDGFSPPGRQALELHYCESLTIPQLAVQMGMPIATAHRNLKRAKLHAAAVIIRLETDPEALAWARYILREQRNPATGKRQPGRTAADRLPEWVPVRKAAVLCGVEPEKVRRWIADPKHPVVSRMVEIRGRNRECVRLEALPLLDEYRYDARHLTARIVTEDDLVEWRETEVALVE